MRARGSHQPPGASVAGARYEKDFVRHAHKLLGLGYATLTPSDFARSEEEDITGELVRAIETVLDDPEGPGWTRWFSVPEEPRVHDPARKGKRRRRLDIRIDSSEARPRARFCFEAKRLGPNHGTSVYLGDEGLQCYLDGRYAGDQMVAGMLGYVQAGDPPDWALKIERAIAKDVRKVGLLKSSPWRREPLVAELTFTYRSGHKRPSVGSPIEIFHTLLLFN